MRLLKGRQSMIAEEVVERVMTQLGEWDTMPKSFLTIVAVDHFRVDMKAVISQLKHLVESEYLEFQCLDNGNGVYTYIP